jgi:uncharacterized membrane protein YgcG
LTQIIHQSTPPPLLPCINAILVLDGDGNRLAGKYYGDFLSMKPIMGVNDKMPPEVRASNTENLRSAFERQVQNKVTGIAARADAAEVVTVAGKIAVFCGGALAGQAPGAGAGDVRIIVIGPPGESELVLAHVCEGMFDALANLMGGSTDRAMVLDNLELVLLLIDEMCDGGLILETSGAKLCNSVLLRDEDPSMGAQGGGGNGGKSAGSGGRSGTSSGGGTNTGEMTIGQALRQAREQLMANMSQRDGM